MKNKKTEFKPDNEAPFLKLDWGFKNLNKNVHVLPGEFVIIGGDSCVGKTTLALQMALSMANAGEPVSFISHDESIGRLIPRIFRIAASLPLKNSSCSASELFLLSPPVCAFDDIRAAIIKNKSRVVFIDSIQPSSAEKPEIRLINDTKIAIELKKMAQELGIILVGVYRPQISEPCVSIQVQSNADVVMSIDFENVVKTGNRRVLAISKNKNGPRTQIPIVFKSDEMRYVEERRSVFRG